MSLPDLINSMFEFASGILLLNNCRILFKDKKVREVSIFTTAVFAMWGYWNLYYYPHLNQMLSFCAGLLVVAANTLWVILAVYYTRKERKDLKEVKNVESC